MKAYAIAAIVVLVTTFFIFRDTPSPDDWTAIQMLAPVRSIDGGVIQGVVMRRWNAEHNTWEFRAASAEERKQYPITMKR